MTFVPVARNLKEAMNVRLGTLKEPLLKMANKHNINPSELVRQMVAYCLQQHGYLKNEYISENDED